MTLSIKIITHYTEKQFILRQWYNLLVNLNQLNNYLNPTYNNFVLLLCGHILRAKWNYSVFLQDFVECLLET